MEHTLAEVIVVAIGVGLLIGLLFSETLGLTAGGLVVPGYLAIKLSHPLLVLMTLLLGLATAMIVRQLSNVMILFGRRRTVIIVLIGFLLGWLCRSFLELHLDGQTILLAGIGYIIPGLVGLWIDRQGAVETLSTLVTSSVLVWLVLVLIYGREMVEWT